MYLHNGDEAREHSQNVKQRGTTDEHAVEDKVAETQLDTALYKGISLVSRGTYGLGTYWSPLLPRLHRPQPLRGL